MKKKIQFLLVVLGITFSSFSQNNSYYSSGDTLYYRNNRATFLKSETFVIIKNINVDENLFEVEKFVFDKNSKKYQKESKFTTSGLQVLRANGNYVSFHANGNKATEGVVVNGKKGSDIWTNYYENGQKKSEEKIAEGNFFSDEVKNVMLNFWDEEGNQLVTDGKGTLSYKTKDSLIFEGAYKKGLKTGKWTIYKADQKRYEENYKNGKLTSGTAFLITGDQVNYKAVKTAAFYKKEDNIAIKKYFDKNLDATNFGVYGDVSVSFTVSKDGTIKDVQIIRGLTPEFNSAFKEQLTKMENWTPATERGENVASIYVLSMRFTR